MSAIEAKRQVRLGVRCAHGLAAVRRRSAAATGGAKRESRIYGSLGPLLFAAPTGPRGSKARRHAAHQASGHVVGTVNAANVSSFAERGPRGLGLAAALKAVATALGRRTLLRARAIRTHSCVVCLVTYMVPASSCRSRVITRTQTAKAPSAGSKTWRPSRPPCTTT